MPDSIIQAIFAHAASTPDKLCVADSAVALSYAAFKERSLRFAAAFRSLGVCAGDRVVFEAVQTADYLAAVLSTHLLGAVFVPVEKNCAPDKTERIRTASEARITVREKAEETDGLLTYVSLATLADRLEPITDPVFPKGEKPSEILFSTGTTGKEKGIVMPHRSAVALAGNVIGGVGILKDNVELIPTPFNHSHALRRFYGNMVMGASVVVAPGVMNIALIFDLIDRYGVTAMDLVPAALSMLLRFSKGRLADYRATMRYIQLGTSPLPESDKEKLCALLPETRLYNFYGSTESGCTLICDFNRNKKPGCLGKPTVNAELAFVDDGKIIEASAETPGLIAMRGKMNMLYYLNDPKTTAEAFFGDYILSSDEGYLDADGDVILIGRRDDVINVGGLKVAPVDVEEVALTFPGIDECLCVAVKDEVSGNRLKLIYVAESDADVVSLRAHMAEKLENYKVPALFERVEKIERTYNGKPNRKAYRI